MEAILLERKTLTVIGNLIWGMCQMHKVPHLMIQNGEHCPYLMITVLSRNTLNHWRRKAAICREE